MRGPLGLRNSWKTIVKAANKRHDQKQPSRTRVTWTDAWLIGRYKTSDSGRQSISRRHAKKRGNIFNKFLDTYGNMPITIRKAQVRIRYRISTLSEPDAANNLFMKALAQVFKYAVKNDIREDNPVTGIGKLKTKTDGWRVLVGKRDGVSLSSIIPSVQGRGSPLVYFCTRGSAAATSCVLGGNTKTTAGSYSRNTKTVTQSKWRSLYFMNCARLTPQRRAISSWRPHLSCDGIR